MSAAVVQFPRRGLTPDDAPRAAGGGDRGCNVSPKLVPATHYFLDCQQRGALPVLAGPAARTPTFVRPGHHIAVGGVHHGLQYVRPMVVLSCGKARRGSAPLAGMICR